MVDAASSSHAQLINTHDPFHDRSDVDHCEFFSSFPVDDEFRLRHFCRANRGRQFVINLLTEDIVMNEIVKLGDVKEVTKTPSGNTTDSFPQKQLV